MDYKIKFNLKEFLYISILPLIITLVYLFFRNNKHILAYNRSNFKFWQIYTKDFINDSFTHYLGNLIVILFVSVIVFLLLSKIKKEELTKYYLLLIALIMPWATQIAYFYSIDMGSNSGYFLGSSGIAAALVGLIISLFFLKEIRSGININIIFILLFFLSLILLGVLFADKNSEVTINYHAHISGIVTGFVIGCLTYYKLKNR